MPYPDIKRYSLRSLAINNSSPLFCPCLPIPHVLNSPIANSNISYPSKSLTTATAYSTPETLSTPTESIFSWSTIAEDNTASGLLTQKSCPASFGLGNVSTVYKCGDKSLETKSTAENKMRRCIHQRNDVYFIGFKKTCEARTGLKSENNKN